MAKRFLQTAPVYAIKPRQSEYDDIPNQIYRLQRQEIPQKTQEIYDSMTKIENNPSLTAQGKREQIIELLQRNFIPWIDKFVAKHFTENINQSKKMYLSLENGVKQLKIDPTDISAALLRREIREHLSQLKGLDRAVTFRRLMEAGNANAYNAVSEGNAIYDLLDQKIVEAGRNLLMTKENPEKAQQYADARKSIGSLARNLKILQDELKPYFNGLAFHTDIDADLPDITNVGNNFDEVVKSQLKQEQSGE